MICTKMPRGPPYIRRRFNNRDIDHRVAIAFLRKHVNLADLGMKISTTSVVPYSTIDMDCSRGDILYCQRNFRIESA